LAALASFFLPIEFLILLRVCYKKGEQLRWHASCTPWGFNASVVRKLPSLFLA